MARSRSGIVTVALAKTRCALSAQRTFCGWCCSCLAQGVSALAQLWLGASQLQAPPATDAVAHGAQAQRVSTLHAGHEVIYAVIYAAAIERTPQIAVPVLRRGDGDRASAHRTSGIQGWCGRAARCSTRRTHELRPKHNTRIATGQQHAQGYGGSARLKNGDLHQTTLAMRVDAATNTASVRPYALAGPQCRANFQKMFSVPPNGT